MAEPILQVRDLVKHFPVRQGIVFKKTVGHVRAVDGVSFDLHKGETLGVVGESGCGKSTLAQVLMCLEPPTSGSVLFEGRDIFKLRGNELRALRREIQIVLQDPYTSLNPRMTVGDIVGEPFEIHPEVAPKDSRRRKVQELLEVVGLNPEHINRYPHQFSGGQRQRIGIARALALRPKVIICDEPVSALDVSIQAQVMNLLDSLQKEFGLPVLHLHRARPVGGASPVRPGRGDVPGQDRGDRHRGRHLRAAHPPVHPGVAVRRPGGRPGRAGHQAGDPPGG